ncbi:bifunctional 3-(3-hydroxy-phenyl)propionate/3-hydroxycinnamic acid hydroxylase [Amycolatopsis rhabdoformis]|uniref:Bifunctional 3-(3-hydroxy-phenyl)propionate/3-hydroxycinnamic acid hydroxylase n=1 Tax=Amycolatopsis rhabdoformis TaxID=1448059 RepID=A0ABZ1IE02_9PSEU|nr:bifunctional 3-(3-hydroxy-phenyl)propionate/3-hydroxycinnamic acid hydroxylase [Amycolatopsis rhabdoformis]WSE32319.1 bifunctional 3-(3-hydroxy-phenyl)propionate/3-hydroxycinnamic acid hydroxylase [Amycolatopsis rhabdoformis]
MNHEYDVAIVGYGPSGLVLASALGKAGHSVVVFERWPSLYGLPRLTHIDGETARIVQAVGDLDHALRDALPLSGYRYLNGSGELLLELNWQGSSCGHPAHLSIYQPDIEDAIDTRVRASGRVEVNQGWSVVAVRPHDDGVELAARPWTQSRTGQWSHGGEERVVTAKYLVGADGANSFVRETLGIQRSDNGVDDRWLNLDTERLRPLPERFANLTQYCDPVRGSMHMPIGKSRQRFELAVLHGEDAAEFERPEFAWTWLRETHGLGPDDVRILRQVVYTFQGRIAETWRRGRVFLIGDAAHTTPPYMGQGACSGMRDGLTLGWKLDLVLRGLAGDELLDTYEAERRPHATAITEISSALGRVANTHDPAAAAARDQAFRDGTAPPPPPFPTIEAGVVHHGSDGRPASPAGTLAPQGIVSKDGVKGLFDDVVGRGFSLVTETDPRSVLSPAQLDFLDRLGVATAVLGTDVEDVDDTYAVFLRDNEVEAFIGRPDFHLFWAGALADLPAAVDALRTRLRWRTGGGTTTAELPPTEVLWRAMSPTRMLDYGMDFADVLELQHLTAAGTPWDTAAEDLADRHWRRAADADQDGRTVTADEAYRSAIACLVFAQMAFNFDTERKRALYSRLTTAVGARAAALSAAAVRASGAPRPPRCQQVEIPFAGGRMFGWLLLPPGRVLGTVVVCGGQSGWGPAYLRQADALNRRGLAALLAEGPGQGRTRLEGGVLLDTDVRAAYRGFVDHLVERGDCGPVGLWGNSNGGLYAATTAASDPRVAAVCVNGAPARPHLPTFRSYVEQAAAMLGTSDRASIQRTFDRISLRPEDRIDCPVLVLHGGQDPLVSLDDQQPFLDAAAHHGDATLRVWDDGEHTIYNHSSERSALVADWFATKLADHERGA